MLMKNLVPPVVMLFALLGTVSCASTPAQDEDFVVYGEEPEGPGIISGETGELTFAIGTAADQNTTDEAETSPDISASDAEEFNAFKRWLKAKQAQDESYQEFLQWLKYEEYRRLQDSL